MKIKILILVAMLAMLLVAAKYSSPVVFPDNTPGLVEASTRGGKNPFTTCRYFSPEYQEYLGRFDAPVVESNPVQFCVDNFEFRTLD